MIHLKSRRNCAPGGFFFRQAQTNWELTSWDFEDLCSQLQKHRLANPSLKLPTDMDSIREEVDVANAMRVAAMPNTETYLTGDLPSPKTRAFLSLKPRLVNAAESVKKVARGAGLLIDWIIDGAEPVSSELANTRAQVCIKCPMNSPASLSNFFTRAASELIRKEIEQRKILDLTTPYDEKLGVCTACACPMALKVHTPIDYIKSHMPAEQVSELWENCWIKSER